MQVLIIIVVVVIAIFIFVRFSGSQETALNTSRPPDTKKPQTLSDNDKVFIVKHVTHDDIAKALKSFCNIYNQDDYAALPRLTELQPDTYAVTFPYDVDFITFCFAVNYLKYPIDIQWNADVMAWATTKPTDEWITGKSVNKKVMLYIARDDKEFDNVFLTTDDNVGYKLGFATGKEKQLLSAPNELYQKPKEDYLTLNGLPYEDFD